MAKESARFDLSGKIAVVTGAAGLLGREHVAALLEVGATVAALDIDQDALSNLEEEFKEAGSVSSFTVDITDSDSVDRATQEVLARLGSIDVLINNAANNPKIESGGQAELSRFENFPSSQWHDDIAVGLTGAFFCARSCGSWMAKNGGGAILNIASDLSVIAPDQRIYQHPGLAADKQPVKPVSYSVVKTGLVGLTRYLATYWASSEVRVNALSPGGVFNDQPKEFVEKLTDKIPLQRMASTDEYRGAVQFLCSDASSYLTGQNIVIDGGRSVW